VYPTSRHLLSGVHTSNHIRKTAPPPPCGHFHDDWAKNVTSRQINVLTKFHANWAKNVTSRVEKCPANWRPCFSPIRTIFELVRDINKSNDLSNFHDAWAKIVTSSVFTRKTAPPTGGHVFQRTITTFELKQHIIKTNSLTNFKLDREIIGTNLLTKFHEDRTINVASIECLRTNVDGRTTDGRRTKTGHKSSLEQSAFQHSQ
ncbi:hypothetical protein DPMN_031338, partial [Dreissena polymorpha]